MASAAFLTGCDCLDRLTDRHHCDTMEVILASAAALIAAAPAMARDPHADILAIQLPGGGMERIQYTGDSSPTVIFAQAPMAEPDFVSEAAFAALDRISAAADWCLVQKNRCTVLNARFGDPRILPPDALWGPAAGATSVGAAPVHVASQRRMCDAADL